MWGININIKDALLKAIELKRLLSSDVAPYQIPQLLKFLSFATMAKLQVRVHWGPKWWASIAKCGWKHTFTSCIIVKKWNLTWSTWCLQKCSMMAKMISRSMLNTIAPLLLGFRIKFNFGWYKHQMIFLRL